MNDAIHISYSSLRTLKECPLKYKYTYIDKIRGKNNIYAVFGTAIHNCIEMFYKGEVYTRKQLLSLWRNSFVEAVATSQLDGISNKDFDRFLQSGYPLLTKFFKRQQEDGLLIKPIETELEFNIEWEKANCDSKVMINGKIDAIFHKDNKTIIVDYKTTSNRKQWYSKNATLQLILYYTAYRYLCKKYPDKYKNENTSVCLHFIRGDCKSYFNITSANRKMLFNNLRKHINKLYIGKYEPTPSDISCKFCVHKDKCAIHNVKNVIKKQLLPYQQKDVDFCLSQKTVLNANDMGLGKTVETVCVGETLKLQNKINNILVVTLPHLKEQWKNEIIDCSNNPDVLVISGTPKERKKLYKCLKFWNIINYDLLRIDIKYINKVWDMIVLDEANVFKNWKTGIARAVNKLKSTGYKYILTATPIENNLAEVYSMVRYLNFRILGKRDAFDRRYVKRDYFNNIIEYKNVQEFVDKIRPILIRHKFDDVKGDLPLRLIKNIYVDFTLQQAKLYDSVVQNLQDYLQRKVKISKLDQVVSSEAFSKFIYLREICDDTRLIGKDHASSKTEKLKEILNKILPNKVIIFSEFKMMISLLKDDIEHNSIVVTGDDSTKQKQVKIEQFKTSTTHNILLCTDVLKYGINLQCAHYLINYDLPWTYASLEQRIGRERRIGQEHKVIVLNLIMKNSCENRILEVLNYKKQLMSIIDNPYIDKVKVPKSNKITYKTLKELIVG